MPAGTVAVQVQPAGAVTFTACEPPVAPNCLDGGEIEYVQPLTWLTVTARPAMVTVPERCGPGFAATLNVALPDPVPEPAVIVSHVALELDAQVHPAPVATDDVRELADAGRLLWAVGLTVKAQTASWFTLTDCSPIVTAPLRAAPVFAVMSNVSCPFPWPLAGVMRVIQETAVEARQEHSGDAATVTVRVPPLPLTVSAADWSVTSHLSGVGPTDVVLVEPQAAASVAPSSAVSARTTQGPDRESACGPGSRPVLRHIMEPNPKVADLRP